MIKITAILENTCYRHNLLALHGQSLLIEINRKKILFDVGEIQEGLLYNMKQMDLEMDDIDSIVISHRHIDHMGALKNLIPLLKDQELYLPLQLGIEHIKESSPKYSFLAKMDNSKYNLAVVQEDLEKILNYKNAKVVTEGFQITENLFSTGSIESDISEQALVIQHEDGGITIIVGCSHPSIELIAEKSLNLTKSNKVRGIIGGFHYVNLDNKEVLEKCEFLHKLNLEYLIPSHCTSIKASKIMKEELGDIVFSSKTGTFGTGNSVILEPEFRFDAV